MIGGICYPLLTSQPLTFLLGKLQESEALFQEGFRLIEPGDFAWDCRSGMTCLCAYIRKEFRQGRALLQENLQLSYQLGNVYQTASILFELGRVALATQRIELAKSTSRRVSILK